ncbi:MAG TPA: DUF4148 domain-containing protein [Gemmataceae bacterium]|nr:DUF4148 domain-containing protein [Gemmataceae bacterium]
MKRIARCIATIAFLTAGVSAFAAPTLTLQQCNDYPFVKPQGPVTHRQLVNELKELEALGYVPGVVDYTYPDDINTAQRRLWEQYAADCPQPPGGSTPQRRWH